MLEMPYFQAVQAASPLASALLLRLAHDRERIATGQPLIRHPRDIPRTAGAQVCPRSSSRRCSAGRRMKSGARASHLRWEDCPLSVRRRDLLPEMFACS